MNGPFARRTYAIVPLLLAALALQFLLPGSVRAQGETALAVTKTVSVNGLGFGTAASAVPGDRLTYDITITNTGSVAATGLTVSDIFGAGQTPSTTAGAPCEFDPFSRQMTCTVGSLAGHTSLSIFVTAGVNAGFTGTIRNEAEAQAQNAPMVGSNITYVTVGQASPAVVYPSPCPCQGTGPYPYPYPYQFSYPGLYPGAFPAGAFTICGLLTALGPAGLTIAGTTFALASGAGVTGSPVQGASYCATLSFNSSGQVTAMSLTPNLPGVGMVCGVYGTGATAGSLTVGGTPFSMGSSVAFPFSLVPGGYYCFLLTPGGAVVGVLSAIPTSAGALESGGSYRVGRMTAS